MSHNAVLGILIDEHQQRDAVHIAIAPVVAAERLSPGQDIGFEGDDLIRVCAGVKPIGIVDPFLRKLVHPEQRFWMFLYPQTITSLRHDWTHPAFTAPAIDAKAASEKWLRNFIEHADCPEYEIVIATAIGGGDDQYYLGEYLHFNDRDAHGDIPPEFWDHVEVVTGKKIPSTERASSFSCSC